MIINSVSEVLPHPTIDHHRSLSVKFLPYGSSSGSEVNILAHARLVLSKVVKFAVITQEEEPLQKGGFASQEGLYLVDHVDPGEV